MMMMRSSSRGGERRIETGRTSDPLPLLWWKTPRCGTEEEEEEERKRKKNRRRNSETERKRKRKGHSPRVFVSSRDSRRRVSDVGGRRRRQRLVDGSFVVDVFFFFFCAFIFPILPRNTPCMEEGRFFLITLRV